MEFIHTKSFRKAFAKLSPVQQDAVQTAVKQYQDDRTHPALRDHALKGRMKEFRAFSAGWDLRVIYREEGGFITIILIDAGSYNQVY
jgi:mRNA-degrading endonuclease YafQ of YafQ-DinJ toxin-antitoxin module